MPKRKRVKSTQSAKKKKKREIRAVDSEESSGGLMMGLRKGFKGAVGSEGTPKKKSSLVSNIIYGALLLGAAALLIYRFFIQPAMKADERTKGPPATLPTGAGADAAAAADTGPSTAPASATAPASRPAASLPASAPAPVAPGAGPPAAGASGDPG